MLETHEKCRRHFTIEKSVALQPKSNQEIKKGCALRDGTPYVFSSCYVKSHKEMQLIAEQTITLKNVMSSVLTQINANGEIADETRNYCLLLVAEKATKKVTKNNRHVLSTKNTKQYD